MMRKFQFTRFEGGASASAAAGPLPQWPPAAPWPRCHNPPTRKIRASCRPPSRYFGRPTLHSPVNHVILGWTTLWARPRGDLLAASTLTARAIALEKPLRGKSNLLNGFNLIWVVQPALQKFPASN